MDKKKIYLCAVLLPLLHPSSYAIEVTVPAWHETTLSLLNQFDNAGEAFEDEINWVQLWIKNITDMDDIVVYLDSLRTQVFTCIRESFAQQDENLAACNLEKAQRDVHIAALNNTIQTLETSIASLNQTIAGLNTQIKNIEMAIATLLDLKEDKIEDLEDIILSMKQKYDALYAQREIFRSMLNHYYQEVAIYTHQSKLEDAALSDELCKKNVEPQN